MDRRTCLTGMAAVGGALLLGEPSASAQDPLDKALSDITQARASVKNMVAAFTQERTIGLLATTVKSEGEMTLLRPDRLRWELKPPDAITYWITPEGLAFATQGGGSSVGKGATGRFGAVLSDMLILLGGDLAKLKDRYDLAVPSRNQGIVLVARPRTEEVKKIVKSLEMSAGPELWSVNRVVIEEKNGDKSVIVFHKVARDVTLDPAKMQPPKK